MVNEFEYIIHCYLEFCQKDKLQKLKKLRTSQANLPITAHRSEILQALDKHKVLLVAGDTGCGKSTQVRNSNENFIFLGALHYVDAAIRVSLIHHAVMNSI